MNILKLKLYIWWLFGYKRIPKPIREPKNYLLYKSGQMCRYWKKAEWYTPHLMAIRPDGTREFWMEGTIEVRPNETIRDAILNRHNGNMQHCYTDIMYTKYLLSLIE
jgi:hypothetical protein